MLDALHPVFRSTAAAAAVAAALLLVAVSAGASALQPPQTLAYRGALFDDAGTPRAGDVALTVRIYDAPIAGALLYVQHFAVVTVRDGVYTLQLGPEGLAADGHTVSLAEALAERRGDGPVFRFAEISVDDARAVDEDFDVRAVRAYLFIIPLTDRA